ncbi:hypothetical protein [Paraglaciecola sp. 2405UD69-4]|uniref:hypothetical protein n=1 Tax=Paraglaciecola sp. 2405UD69-4 TaxID=3391836 RepID=UPI0039C902D1
MKASLLYSSTFSDNGNKVTEVRYFDNGSSQTWEWLDLTISNGITYEGVIADLSDGLLDGSALTASNATLEAMIDVEVLAESDQSGWQTVSVQGIADLFYTYFGIDFDFDLNVDTELIHDFGVEEPLVESFLQSFGDTWLEYITEELDVVYLYDDAFSIGYTSDSLFEGQRFVARIDDFDVLSDDRLSFNRNLGVVDPSPSIGTWLVRQVSDEASEVNEPSSFVLLVTALVGLILSRRRAM